jgi:hypothetical protein
MNRSAIMRRVSRANPIRDTHSIDAGNTHVESTLAHILATPRVSRIRPRGRHERRLSLRAAAIAAGAFLAVFLPALAVASHYGVFHISNTGQPIDRSQLSLNDLSALDESGFTSDVNRLGERAGVAFYVAHSRSGGLCFATGSASGSTPKLDYFVGCQRHSPSAFPSPEQPILDLSPLKTTNPRVAVYVRRLVGFAADGVDRVGFVDRQGTIHATPVVDNIYATDWFTTDVAGTAIVALDRDGNVLYRQGLLLLGDSSASG